jgi:hypothetical protein
VDEPGAGSELSCGICGQRAPIRESLAIDGELYALCDSCSRSNPVLVRAVGSTARILGRDVDDVRGKLRD